MSYGNSFQRWIYDHSPNFLQNYIVSYYGQREKNKRYGKQFHHFYRFLQKAQWYSKDQIENAQNEKLKNFIVYSYENVPYYRRIFDEAKIRPTDIRTKSDLTKLPILGL